MGRSSWEIDFVRRVVGLSSVRYTDEILATL